MNQTATLDKQDSFEEKRSSPRANWQYPVSLKQKNGRIIFGELRDISNGGIKCYGMDMELFELGDICHFYLILSKEDPEFKIEGQAKVARKLKKRIVGLSFEDLDVKSQIHLRQMVSFHLD